MSALTLRLRDKPDQRIDMSAFTPQLLAGDSAAQVARIPLWLGNRQIETGELFAIEGQVSETIVIQSDSDRLDQIGEGLKGGTVRVEGRAGAYVGRGMQEGTILVSGDAGLGAGCAMSGGCLLIDGDAGDYLGGAITGERQGMRGGTILIKGSAGDRTGDVMRRGIIIIEGDSGDYCASRMVAGTLVVLGKTGLQTGQAMNRGTLITQTRPESMPATFNHNGTQDLSFLTLLNKHLQESVGLTLSAQRGNQVERWLGDLACDGKGEILIWR